MVGDLDPVKTREWLDSLDSVLEFDCPDRATLPLDKLADQSLARCEADAAAALTAAAPAAVGAIAKG